MSRHWIALLLALTLISVSAEMALATTVMQGSLSEVLGMAAYAFAGTVDSMNVALTDGVVVTHIHFSRLEWAKGAWSGDTLTLRQSGGIHGGKSYGVVGSPGFDLGRRYIILARKGLGSPPHFLPIIGIWQGFYPLQYDSTASGMVVANEKGWPLVGFRNHHPIILLPPDLRRSPPPSYTDEQLAQAIVEYRSEDPGTRVSEEEFLAELRRLMPAELEKK